MIHYITSTGVGNAWVGNELMSLADQDIPFRLHSLRQPTSTFFKSGRVEEIASQTNYIYPLGAARVIVSVLLAPFLFPRHFFPALWNSLFGRKESFTIRLKSLLHFCVACAWARDLRHQRVSHIHSQWINSCGTVGMYAAWLLGKSFSFTGHAADLFRERCALKDKIARAEFIVCISSFHRDFYIAEGADPDKLMINYCGIDTSQFSPICTTDPDVEKSQGRPLRLLSAARLVEKKGFKYLISACKTLAEKGVDFECVIAGDGPLLNQLEEQIVQHNLAGRVSLTGLPLLQEDIPNFMRSGDIYCLPCVWASDGDVDGLPQMLMEAMACGVPVISTRLVGIADLIEDGKTGLLAEPNDADDLSEKIGRLISDKSLRDRFSESGREKVKSEFDLSHCLESLLNKFRQNIKKHNAKGTG
ncbi:Glycosyltransferase KanE [Gammaproteobacteria bacterium MOLA455]|nr:Glycosyltransferase KanE [Gammaproteobacteria bacterium MOLA455]